MSYVVITQTVTARETSKSVLDYVDASEIAWEIGYESIGDPEFVSVNVQCTICDRFNHHCRCIIPGCDPERASVMAFGAFPRSYGHQEPYAQPYPHAHDVTCTTCQRRFVTIAPNHYQCAECEFPWLVTAVYCLDCGCLVPITTTEPLQSRPLCDDCYADHQG